MHLRQVIRPVQSPYTPASKDTFSRWIADIIMVHAEAGASIGAHNVRSHVESLVPENPHRGHY